jgi:diadenosine tetraphosphate (Ap4A) HIT family hydrolase
MLKDFLGTEWQSACMGCQIANETTTPPGGVLFKTKFFHINQDPIIPMPGFFVIASNRHIQKLSELTDEEFTEYAKLIQISRKIIEEVFEIEYVTMVEEEHSCHFHTWFFPWSKALLDGRRPSLDLIRPLMNEARNIGITAEEWQNMLNKLDIAKDEFKRQFQNG